MTDYVKAQSRSFEKLEVLYSKKYLPEFETL